MRSVPCVRSVALAWLAAGLLALAGCGSGSGRSGTDVRVSGTGPTTAVQSGSQAVFEMVVTNAGEYAADDLRITNEVGGQIALLSITCVAEGGAVCPEVPSIAMTVPSLREGGTLRFTVTTQANPTARGTVFNRMSASFAYETDSADNTATVTATAFSLASNLVVSGSGPAGTVTGGSTFDFQMQVRNEGPDPATGVRIVNDGGTALVINGITCAASGGAVCPAAPAASMEIDSIPAGGALDFTVSATVANGINGSVTNTMQATADADSNRGDNTFTAQATVVTPQAGVFVTGVGPAGTIAGGATATFVMTVSNAGPDAATGINIVNSVGSNLSFSTVRCTGSGGAACPAALGPVMAVPTLPAGGTLRFDVDAVVANGTSGLLTNTLTANASNDPDRNDNSATAVATARTPRAALSLSGTGPSGTVAGGSLATFEMRVTNNGPDPATGLQVRNTVSGNLSFAGATCSASGGAVCPGTVGVVTDVGTLAVGGQLTFRVNALVAAGTNGTISNTLVAAADNVAGGGNSVVATGTAFSARSSLAVTGTGPAAAVPAGSPATFRMTVSNAGPDAASAVRLVNTLSGNLTLTGITCAAATGGAICPATVGPLMDIATLPVGGSLGFDVTATVAAGTQGSILSTMTASVTAGGVRTEATGVGVGSAFVVVTPRAQLALVGTGPAAVVAGGAVARFEMRVTNNGPDPATGLQVRNIVGSNLSFLGATCTASGGGVCPGSVGVVSDVGTLAVGGQLAFSVDALVAAGANGAISNTLQATGDNLVGGAASVVATGTAFSARSNLSVTGTGPAAAVPAGGSATFRMTVSNAGPDAASAVRLVNTLSGNLTLTGVSCAVASGGATCPATTGAAMDITTLPVGGSLAFDVTATVATGTQGSILSTLTASVTAGGVRTETAGVAVGSAYAVNVAVSGSGPAGPLAGGTAGEFLMDVSNAGPGTALDLSLTNTLSAGLDARGSIVCVQAVGATCPSIGAGAITVASLPAGASLRFSVPFTVTAGTNATVGNTMTATVAGDSRPADNSATVTFSAVSVDVAVSQVVASQSDAGSTATFTAVVANPGNQAATNLVITQALSGAGAAGLSASITCAASPAATCPTPGPTMTLASLAPRSTLTFTITVPTQSSSRGALTNTLAVTSDGDPNANNNSAVSTTTVVDPRSGAYKAIAANGNVYDLTVDFDAGTYTMAGAGNAQTFGAPTGSEYVVAGAVRFRVAEDLIVGGHDFGGGVQPYLAVRRYATTLADAAGQYNLVIRDLPSAGPVRTRAAVAVISGNQMSVCNQDAADVAPPGSRCAAGRQQNYTLAVSANVYTATEVGGSGTTVRFFVARTGAARLLAGATGTGAGGASMRIGLQEQSGLIGGTLGGASTSGNWVPTMTLTPTSYLVADAGGDNNSATLGQIDPDVLAMRTGVLVTGADRIWVMQSSPLAVAFGDADAVGSGRGLLQIVLPP